MRVFLGWAGEEANAVALALKEWLPLVCPGLQPWISEDITKGARWSAEIAKTLRESRAGVFVLTPDNLTSVWLHYEAGAISNVERALVCTFLRRVDKAAVKPPLDVFQHTTAGNKEDTRRLVGDLAALLPDKERAWDEEQRRTAFDRWGWDELVKRLEPIKPPKGGAAAPRPTTDEMLAEILDAVRSLGAQRRTEPSFWSAEQRRLIGEHVAAARLQIRAGQLGAARDQLEAILAGFPNHPDALKLLLDLVHRERAVGATPTEEELQEQVDVLAEAEANGLKPPSGSEGD